MVFSLQSNIKNVYRESMGKYARFRRKGAKMRESVSGGVPFLAATQSLLARSHTSKSGIVTIVSRKHACLCTGCAGGSTAARTQCCSAPSQLTAR